jgi:hypothetical protein
MRSLGNFDGITEFSELTEFLTGKHEADEEHKMTAKEN